MAPGECPCYTKNNNKEKTKKRFPCEPSGCKGSLFFSICPTPYEQMFKDKGEVHLTVPELVVWRGPCRNLVGVLQHLPTVGCVQPKVSAAPGFPETGDFY